MAPQSIVEPEYLLHVQILSDDEQQETAAVPVAQNEAPLRSNIRLAPHNPQAIGSDARGHGLKKVIQVQQALA